MTREELSIVSAKYAGVHRAAFEVIGSMMELAELNEEPKSSADRAERMELFEAYQCTRVKLLEAMQWQRTLHQMLMTRTEEGRAAMKQYQEELEELRENAKKAAESAEKSGEKPVSPTLTLRPKVEGADNG